MKRLFPIILAGLLIHCQTEKVNLNGHYVSLSKFDNNSYLTLDIVDSLVLINRTIVFMDQRDTIIIDQKTNSFVRSTREMFPFFDFRVSKDTVILEFAHDAGTDKIKFIKDIPTNNDYFSNSLIDVELEKYLDEPQVVLEGLQIKNVTVGTLKKGIKWAEADSNYIEFENEVFLDLKDISKLGPSFESDSIRNWVICLNLDKQVPSSLSDRLKSELVKNYKDDRLIQTKINGNELLYVKMTTAGNNVHVP